MPIAPIPPCDCSCHRLGGNCGCEPCCQYAGMRLEEVDLPEAQANPTPSEAEDMMACPDCGGAMLREGVGYRCMMCRSSLGLS